MSTINTRVNNALNDMGFKLYKADQTTNLYSISTSSINGGQVTLIELSGNLGLNNLHSVLLMLKPYLGGAGVRQLKKLI